MKIMSNGGMVVKMLDAEYGELMAKYGTGTKYQILSTAGRVYKHRRVLQEIQEQQLTPEQHDQIEHLAQALAVQFAIENELINMGFENYLSRSQRGGLMPESWSRTVSQAREHIDISQIVADEHDKNIAMQQLGLYIPNDEKHSTDVSSWCRWEITVPDGWGGENFKKAPLGF